jgi:hypothetical protein
LIIPSGCPSIPIVIEGATTHQHLDLISSKIDTTMSLTTPNASSEGEMKTAISSRCTDKAHKSLLKLIEVL